MQIYTCINDIRFFQHLKSLIFHWYATTDPSVYQRVTITEHHDINITVDFSDLGVKQFRQLGANQTKFVCMKIGEEVIADMVTNDGLSAYRQKAKTFCNVVTHAASCGR